MTAGVRFGHFFRKGVVQLGVNAIGNRKAHFVWTLPMRQKNAVFQMGLLNEFQVDLGAQFPSTQAPSRQKDSRQQ